MLQVTGFKTVAELENYMSINELYEWYSFYSEEPFYADRIEIQLATVCTMVGGFGGSKATHADFMVRKTEKKVESKKNLGEQLLKFFS